MISAQQFQDMQARCTAGRGEAVPADAVNDEGSLHDQILAECRLRLWPVSHSRMDMATTQGKGTPDFCIAADGGRTFWVECKTAKGKLSPEQLGWQMLLERNGHHYSVIRSFSEFLELIKTKTP
jgi:hypothetical protein